MRAAYLVSLSALVGAGLAQASDSTFEPADFSVIDALQSNGVNFSALPELVGLVERSSLGACSIAVSLASFSEADFRHAQRASSANR